MKTLLFFNTLRGKDSTGVTAYSQTRNEVETKKNTVPGYEFVQFEWIDRLLANTVGCWIGHGRAQTVGAITKVNAHPFEIRDDDDCITFFGAHNGTLKNKWEIERDHLDNANFGTDSEALINLIEKVGPKKAIAATDGAWALTWWDAKDGSINFLRNKERPFCFAYTDDRKAILWASEPWMLKIACQREGLELLKTEKDAEQIFWTNEDTLYSWAIPTFKGDDQTFASPKRKGGLLGKPEKKYFPPYKAQQHGYHNPDGKWVPWYDSGEDDVIIAQATKKAEEKGKAGKDEAAAIKPEYFEMIGFEGKIVSKAWVSTLKHAGCDWCGDKITGDGFAFLSPEDLCCNRCLLGEHIKVDVENGVVVERVLGLVR